MINSFKDYPEYFYAGFWIRFFAFIVDIIMIGSLQRIMFFYMRPGTLLTILSLFVYLSYFVFMTKLNKGQTIGKMIFGIKVICLKEEKLTWKTVIVREGFGRYLQKVVLILYGITIFTPYKQHLVDMLSDTSVVTINYLRLLEDKQTKEKEAINTEMSIE